MSEIKKCDVFTPDDISKLMSSFLHDYGNVLEPSVGTGNLLKFLDLDRYKYIDVYETEKEYLNKIIDHKKIKKHNRDFLKTKITKKYDNIIMNPPYIKFQELDDDYRKFIKKNFQLLEKGNIDIYLAFLLKCLDLLNDTGVMVSITPNSYLFNKSCLNFRKYLIDNKLISKIIDYKSKKVFKNINVYCCVSVFTKSDKESFEYNDTIVKYNNIVNYNIFSNEKKFMLKDIVKISGGIATLRDSVFVHNKKLFNEPCWKNIYKVSKNVVKYVIFPYDDNGIIISEDKFKLNNPKTYNYLLEHKNELEKRDRGKKKYETWYAFGRRQGITLPKSKELIFLPTIGNMEFPIYKKEPTLILAGLSIEIIDKTYTIDNIIKIINDNKKYIMTNSLKRGSDWFNISSTIIKSISFD
jgi:adenine-specific DNA-methyltransferase